MKTAALYARVSTTDQNTDMQVREMRHFCDKRQFEIAEFVDTGWSGTKKSRPSFDKMMVLARRRAFDVVIVWKLDRFARSLVQLVTALQEFNELGIEFVSLHDQIDTTTAAGKLMFHITAAFAEFERTIISERTKAALDHARAKGIRLGRPRVEVDVPAVNSYRERGKSWRWIGHRLKVSPATIQRVLQKGGIEMGHAQGV